MRWILAGFGILLALSGAARTLQAFHVFGGDSTTGTTAWVVIGPAVFIVGVMLILFSARRFR